MNRSSNGFILPVFITPGLWKSPESPELSTLTQVSSHVSAAFSGGKLSPSDRQMSPISGDIFFSSPADLLSTTSGPWITWITVPDVRLLVEIQSHSPQNLSTKPAISPLEHGWRSFHALG